MPRIRQIALALWVLLMLTLTGVYAMNPEWLEPAVVLTALRQSGQPVLLGYVVLSILRPFTLIPSTVLIVVGVLLFPNQPQFVMVSSLAGIVASATLVYYFFEFLGLGEFFERKHANRVRWLEKQMEQKGFWIVLAWSAFPFVPTDAICYVAGTLRMRFWKFACGVALGELPLVGFYVMAGGMVLA